MEMSAKGFVASRSRVTSVREGPRSVLHRRSWILRITSAFLLENSQLHWRSRWQLRSFGGVMSKSECSESANPHCSYNTTGYTDPYLKSLTQHIRRSHTHVLRMCEIMRSAAESPVHYDKLRDKRCLHGLS